LLNRSSKNASGKFTNKDLNESPAHKINEKDANIFV
jgi:hypothetical protein